MKFYEKYLLNYLLKIITKFLEFSFKFIRVWRQATLISYHIKLLEKTHQFIFHTKDGVNKYKNIFKSDKIFRWYHSNLSTNCSCWNVMNSNLNSYQMFEIKEITSNAICLFNDKFVLRRFELLSSQWYTQLFLQFYNSLVNFNSPNIVSMDIFSEKE